MGYIDRSYDGGAYHYARANGSAGVFWTTASYNNAGVGSPVASLVDLYHREVVHVTSGNYVLIYKRAVKTSGTGVTNNVWRWHAINPITQNGSVYTTDSGTGRRFRKLIQSSVTPTYTTRQSTDYGSTAYREELTMPMTFPVWSLEALQITSISTNFMQTMSKTPATGIGLALDHTFRGVTIEEPVFKHFLWSTDDYGVTPTAMRYYVQKNAGTDVHRVFNLKPGQEYLVSEDNTGLPSGYYKYTFTETFNTGFTANNAGIVEFTPSQIGAGGVTIITVGITDAAYQVGSSTVTTPTIFGVGVADAVPPLGSDNVSPAGPSNNIFPVSVVDAHTNSLSSLSFGVTEHVHDSGGSVSETVTVNVTGAPHTPYTQKRIDGPIASLVPNEDLSIQFFGCEPDDGVFYTKLNDADDTDFVRPISTPIITNAELRFGLSNGSASVGTIKSIQFAIRLRTATFVSITNPTMRCDLYTDQTLATRVAGFNIPLMGTNSAVWLRSPVIAALVKNGDIPNLVLRLRPKADVYDNTFGSFQITISSALVDVSGDAPQKVI